MDKHQKDQDGCYPILRRNFLLVIVATFAAIYKDLINQSVQGLFFTVSHLSQYVKSVKSTEQMGQGLPDDSVRTTQPAIAQNNYPVTVTYKTLFGVPFYQTTINLTDPKNLITIGLANNATQANSDRSTHGDELFENMVDRFDAVVVANGTFFSLDHQKRVMGNMVAGGKFLKYSPWENYGTTLGLRAGNHPEMITARIEGKPQWQEHWFSLTCGPRLLKNGNIWLAPKSEGFRDPAVLDVAYRTAIGFTADHKLLILVAFLAPLSLASEAKLMKSIGCFEAMNLDGGTSVALAHQGKVLISPQRALTNVIVVYDRHFPAPTGLKTSWEKFQMGDRPVIPQ
jgi:exopolysaccharide biosynthesis protein